MAHVRTVEDAALPAVHSMRVMRMTAYFRSQLDILDIKLDIFFSSCKKLLDADAKHSGCAP